MKRFSTVEQRTLVRVPFCSYQFIERFTGNYKEVMSINRRFVFRVSVGLLAVIFLSFFLGSDAATQNAQEQKSAAVAEKFRKFETPDNITRLMRDDSKEFAIARFNDESERSAIYETGNVIEDYGSFILVANDKSQKIADFGAELQKLETTINLPNGKFEPFTDESSQTISADALKADASGKNYYIVQFGGIAKGEWLESLRQIGVEIVQYVPHQAFIVYGDAAAIGKIANHSKVRWAGKYAEQQKISPELNDFTARPENEKTAMFDVAVFSRADLAVVSSEFANTVNGQIINQIKLPSNFFNILRVEIPVGELSKIAAMPNVFRVDPYTKPIVEDERSAQIVAGNIFSSTALLSPGYNPLAQFGSDGSNVTVAVVDDGVSIPGNGGFYISSENTANGPLRGAEPGATGGHGHFNASIIAGSTPFGALDPQGYNYGLGIAPKANIVNIPFTKSGYTGDDAQAVDDTLNAAGPNGIKSYISNNSWGNGANGNSYDSYAAMYDGFVHDASLVTSSFDPLSIIFSAGNCGNSPVGFACSGQNGLTRPKVAKNIITVGNSENLRSELGGTSANNADDLASSSSRGPAADGRIKPDVTAPGTVITGSRAGNGGGLDGGTIDANHYYSSGTSHSAPQVAGAAALFTSYWKRINGGTVNPSPAMIKATIINTAQEMNGANAGGAIPNGNEGWGRINMKYMLNTGVRMKYIDQETTLSGVGEKMTIEGTVVDPTKPVRVSLVWTDPPGVANPALVNNLDLTVKIGANTYKGNVFGGGTSITGGSFDTLNNVENVFLPVGISAGTPFTIEVAATALNGDGRYGNASGFDQTFALVAYNYSSCTYTVSPASQTVPISGGSVSVDVSTQSFCSWSAVSSLSWATVTPDTQFTGNGTVTLSVQPNTGGASRSGLVRIAGRDFNLQQQGTNCSYALNPTSANVNAGGGGSSFSVTAQTGCAWNAVSNASWITVTSGGSGSGNGTITFSAQANSGIARNGTITVGGQTFTVNQASGCSYILSAAGANFGATGGTGTVNVTGGNGCAWTAVSNTSWITVTSGNNGSGNGTVTFSVAANSGASGTGTITIAGQTFTVTQSAGCSYTLSPANASVPVGGGTTNFNINAGAGCAWNTVSNISWLTITSGSSGSGNGLISVSVAANTGGSRTGTITAGGQTFTVNQSGVCTYSLSSTSISGAAGGFSGSVTVTTGDGCAWSASSNASWITITNGSAGNGNGSATFSIAANSGTARNGTITVAGQIFTVNQNGGTFAPRRSPFDFDGDNKTDLSIFRPSLGEWWYLKSSNVGNAAFQFGSSSDKLVPADFTGDGKTDIAFFRPSTGFWFVLRSEDNSFFSFPFGTNGDVPAPADFDGDGKADPAVFRPSTQTWFISFSSGGTSIQQFGISGDVPVVADYDGDSKADIAIYRPSSGEWWLNRSSAGATAFQFGNSADKPVQGDYTGDGKTDVAFFRPSTNEWFVLRSENASFYSAPFGASGDVASPGDYDADGKSDFAIFRPSSNMWFVQRSGAGTLIQTFGINGDKPVPSAFIP